MKGYWQQVYITDVPDREEEKYSTSELNPSQHVYKV